MDSPAVLLRLPLPINLRQTLCGNAICLFNLIKLRNDGPKCATMILMMHFPLRSVRNTRIRTQNLCHLHQSSVKAPDMLYRVALQKTNVTRINPISHPIAGDCGLLLPIHQNLLLLKTKQSISCSSHERPRSPIAIPTTSTVMPVGWVASSLAITGGFTVWYFFRPTRHPCRTLT